MARLTTRPASNQQNLRLPTASPNPSNLSDQENEDPRSARRSRGKGPSMESSPPASLPTPTSENNDSSRGQKRKRVVVTVPEGDEETDKFNKYFDPNQDPDVRRDVKRRSRALEREFQENRDELLRSRGGEGLINTIDNANAVFKEVKQTNDATLDSRLLVNISDLAYKKSAQLVLGDTSTGIDVELFLSKCITFMRNGSSTDDNPTSTQRRRNAMRHDEDDDDDGDDDENANGALDWELLGQHACFPFNSRPAAPSFLLGPLSVEKKQRAQTQRRGRQAKDNAGQEARPDQLSREDLTQSNENQLTSICARIHTQLRKHCKRGARSVEQAGLTTLESREAKALLRENRITATGGPSLFEYVINPDSFGQTVENLFYVSFLIKEGSIGITADDDGLPTLNPTEPRDIETQRREKTSKHQAILSLDYGTWQSLTKAFEIKEPLIPHRDDTQPTQVGARGWYS